MSRFDRYIFFQLLAVFGFFSLVLVSVYWINRAVGLFDRLIGDGQTALVFLEFSLLTLPNVIALVLPVSAFAAVVQVTNRLARESELVVMQTTGFSAFRLARPVLFFGLAVAGMMLLLTHVLVPDSRAELARRTAELSQNAAAQFITEGRFTHPAPGLTLYIRQVEPTGELSDIYLADDRDPDLRTTYTAQRALFARAESGPKLVMFAGMTQTLAAEGQRLSVTRFADFTYDLAGLVTETFDPRRSVAQLSTANLLAAEPALLRETEASRAEFLGTAHNRFAQPLLATAAALIGFSALMLGAYSRFGLWRQIAVAVVLLIVVQAVTTYGSAAALRTPGGWPLVYAGPALGCAIGWVLLWLAEHPWGAGRGAVRPPSGLGAAS